VTPDDGIRSNILWPRIAVLIRTSAGLVADGYSGPLIKRRQRRGQRGSTLTRRRSGDV
jgi:hypothetical protein